MKTLKYDDYLNEGFNAIVPTGDQFGEFSLKLLAARDQAHIFHWQTNSFAEHEAFGKFYDEFLENIDLLVELIMGIKERPVFGNNATISLKDYSEGAVVEFFMHLYNVLTNEIQIVIDPIHEEVYDHARLIISQIDKLKYLLTLK